MKNLETIKELNVQLREKISSLRTASKRLEWQDRYIDELLGLIKQKRLPVLKPTKANYEINYQELKTDKVDQ